MVLERLNKTVRKDIFLEITTKSANNLEFKFEKDPRLVIATFREDNFDDLTYEQYAEGGIKDFKIESCIISRADRKYRLYHEHIYQHTRSQGGYAQDLSRLTNEDSDKLVLEQYDYNSWITISGDFENYSNQSEHYVRLHEEDELGRAIFEAIREFRKTKNWSGEVK